MGPKIFERERLTTVLEDLNYLVGATMYQFEDDSSTILPNLRHYHQLLN